MILYITDNLLKISQRYVICKDVIQQYKNVCARADGRACNIISVYRWMDAQTAAS